MTVLQTELTPGQRVVQTLVGGVLALAMNVAGFLLLTVDRLVSRR